MIGERVAIVDLHVVISVSGKASSKLHLSTTQDRWPKIQKTPKPCQTEQLVITNWSRWTFVSRWESGNSDAFSLTQDCNTSIALDPHFIKPKLRRAFALRSQEKWEESLSGYKGVLKLEPTCGEAKEGLGYCASFLKQMQCNAVNGYKESAGSYPAGCAIQGVSTD